jgi:hypothetical protein
MAWEALEVNAERVAAIVQSAAQAVSHLREASYALEALEDVRAAQQRSLASSGEEHADKQQQQQQQQQLLREGQADAALGGVREAPGSQSASASAQAASDRVKAALVDLLLSQRQGHREQQRAFDHLRMVLETYVSTNPRVGCAAITLL